MDAPEADGMRTPGNAVSLGEGSQEKTRQEAGQDMVWSQLGVPEPESRPTTGFLLGREPALCAPVCISH